MIRWPIQVVGLGLYGLALVLCWRRFRAPMPRWYLGPVLAWLVVQALFGVALVVRVVWYGGEPPLSQIMNWWASVVWLSGGLCLALTFWLSGGEDRA